MKSRFLIKLVLLAICLVYKIANAAYSVRRPQRRVSGRSSSSRYDRSITLFNDEGKLMQVEYAMRCTERGLPVVCLNLGDCIMLIVVRPPVSSPDVSEGGDQAFAEKVHRIDHGILLVTTGLAGDGRALAQAARITCQRMRMNHGEAWAPTVSEIAKEISGIQHELTRTAGARPFGVTATILGCDWGQGLAGENLSTDSYGKALRVFQSEPGGVLDEFHFCSAGGKKISELQEIWEKYILISTSANDDKNRLHSMNNLLESLFDVIVDKKNCEDNALHDEAKSENEKIRESTDLLDVWVLSPDKSGRGGARIRCARAISSKERLTKAVQALFQLE